MKRFLAALLIVASVFALCACYSEPEPKYYGTWVDETQNVVLVLKEDGAAVMNVGLLLETNPDTKLSTLIADPEMTSLSGLMMDWVAQGFGTIWFHEKGATDRYSTNIDATIPEAAGNADSTEPVDGTEPTVVDVEAPVAPASEVTVLTSTTDETTGAEETTAPVEEIPNATEETTASTEAEKKPSKDEPLEILMIGSFSVQDGVAKLVLTTADGKTLCTLYKQA